MKFIKKFLMILLLCIAISVPVFGVYSWTDENGIRHFSDAPPEGIAEDAKVQKDYGDSVKNEKALYEKAQQPLGDYRGDPDYLVKAGVLLARILEFKPDSAPVYVGLSQLVRKQGRIIGKNMLRVPWRKAGNFC